MKKFTLLLLTLLQQTLFAQQDSSQWKVGGGLGLDLAQMLLINPKVGAGENRIGLGANTNFYANYQKGRFSTKNEGRLQFGVQKLGRGNKPFQKNLDELRISSAWYYALTPENPLAYALDMMLLSQITPTFLGNFLSPQNSQASQYPIARFFAPATINIAPGLAYKPNENLSILLAPASMKIITVLDDSIARLGNANNTASLHGNPYGRYASAEDFRRDWKTQAKGQINDSLYYGSTALQLGATLKINYNGKFIKDDKGKHRLGISSSLTLYSNYLRDPQNIDLDWTMTTDLYIIKGLSISLGLNAFYDHDVFVQLDRDDDINTGVNGYESTGRRLSFTQTLLIKYNYLF